MREPCCLTVRTGYHAIDWSRACVDSASVPVKKGGQDADSDNVAHCSDMMSRI